MSACTSAGEMNLVTTAGLELMAYPPDLGPENMKPKHSPSFDNSPKSSEVLHLGKDLDGPTLPLVQNLTNAEAILNPPCSTVEIQGAESVPNRCRIGETNQNLALIKSSTYQHFLSQPNDSPNHCILGESSAERDH
jgi:hypothetical protein